MSFNALQFGELLAALCDGRATTAQFDELSETLRHEPAAREYYYQYIELHGLLQWDLPVEGHGPEERGPEEHASAAVENSPAVSPLLGFLPESIRGMLPATMPFSPLSLSIGVVLASLFWASMAVWVIPWWRAPADLAEAPKLPAQVIGRLTGTSSCFWAGARHPQRPGDELVAGTLQLVRGTAELTLSSGVRVTIEGPTRVELESPAQTFLYQGRLCAKVPVGATGYTVATPSVTIVDLGTEFGVETAESGDTNVQVFVGKVAIKPELGKEATVLEPSAPLILSASEAKRIEVDATTGQTVVRDIPAGDGLFLRDLPSGALRESPRVKYPPSLLAYWNFDEDHGPAWDQASLNHGGLADASRVPGLIGRGAVRFDDKPGQMVRVPSKSGELKFTQGVAIEIMFASTWDGRPGNYDEFLRKDDGDNRVLLAFQHDDRGNQVEPWPVPMQPVLAFGLNIGGQYKELDMPVDGLEGRPSLAQLTDNKLHYLAAVYDVTTGKKAIFIDGTLRYSEQFPPDSELRSGGPDPLCFGNNSGGGETFSGVLDEIALHNRAMSDDEIALHWANIKQGKSFFEEAAARSKRESK